MKNKDINLLAQLGVCSTVTDINKWTQSYSDQDAIDTVVVHLRHVCRGCANITFI
jgi:hypothetical protein